MCPTGYHYISIVIPAFGHRDVQLHIRWLNLSNDVTYIVSAKQFNRFQAPSLALGVIHDLHLSFLSMLRVIETLRVIYNDPQKSNLIIRFFMLSLSVIT